jgi:predicted phage terminase large subunit-like protein
MLCSYAAEFAASWGRKARDITDEHGPYVFGVKVREDVAARDEWEIEKTFDGGQTWQRTEGGMKTAGVGGPITGRGADLIIIDDPIKNAEEAFSETMREKVWDWYSSTLYTRLEPNARIVLIMTRWHEDDLVGRLLTQMKEGGEKWEIINLPALAEENDLLGRPVGEPLWPERYDKAFFEAWRKEHGEYWFSALYQQRPTPVGAAMFKQAACARYRIENNSLLIYQPNSSIPAIWSLDACIKFTTVDLAASKKTKADFTVLSTWAQTPHHDLALLSVTRERFEGPDHVPLMIQVWMTHKPTAFYIESTGFQLTTVQTALRSGLPALPAYPDTDKIARAIPAAAKMNSGKLALPFQAEWLPDVEHEIFRFPATKHDDITDTFSLAALVNVGAGYVGNL